MIFFSGGGNGSQSYSIDDIFVKSLNGGNVLYIPVAMERDSLGYEACYGWIVSTLSQHSADLIDISMKLDLSDITYAYLSKFKAVYIGGGNTYKLRNEVWRSGFNKKLLKFISGGGVIYGGSAGAIILGQSIEIVKEEKDREINTSGLGLLGKYSIRCHYKDSDDKLIDSFIEENNTPVIALPEGSGLVMSNSKAEVVGKRPVIVFKSRNKKVYLKEGDEFHYQ